MAKIVVVDDLMKEMSNFKSQKDVAKFIKKYRSLDYLTMIMINYAEELISKNKYDIAILIYLEIDGNKRLKCISDEVTLWFRLGEYYINKGEIEKGKAYLIELCDEIENYEESFEESIDGDFETLDFEEDIETEIIEIQDNERLRLLLWHEVESLPDDETKVIKKRYEDNLSCGETGSALGIDEGQVKNIQAKTLRKLRKSKIITSLVLTLCVVFLLGTMAVYAADSAPTTITTITTTTTSVTTPGIDTPLSVAKTVT